MVESGEELYAQPIYLAWRLEKVSLKEFDF